jgi:hypothetical protein
MAIYLFDDLIRDTERVCRELYTFLGVTTNFKPNLTKKHNVTFISSPGIKLYRRTFESNGLPIRILVHLARKICDQNVRNKLAKRITRKLYKKSIKPLPLSNTTRAYLFDIFREDIKKTSKLLKRDLEHWINLQ